jgi:hypothetical protein
MDQTFRFFTDAATLAIFDPGALELRVEREGDWWCTDFSQLHEVRTGAIALVSLGGDGVYQGRITDRGLTADERDYAAERVTGLGVEVVSGSLFVGPGESLPDGGPRFTQDDLERGTLCEISNGAYGVDVYAIHWFDSPRWWTDDDRRPDVAPPDFVVCLHPRSGPIAAITDEPRLFGVTDRFLFDSPTRQIGPQPGMILTTTVRKGPNGLTLKDCGPGHYYATLTDYSQVAWKDTIRFRVISVDHDAKEMIGEFIEIVRTV